MKSSILNLLNSFFYGKRVPPQFDKKKIDIKGIDLKIDSSVQKLCEAYSSSSGSTRSILYILVVVNVLSIMSVINTHWRNWTDSRIKFNQYSIQILHHHAFKDSVLHFRTLELLKKKQLADLEKLKATILDKDKYAQAISISEAAFNNRLFKLDSTYKLASMLNRDQIKSEIERRTLLVRNSIENFKTVKVPILGDSFDINNLALVSGISFVLLLLILRFTLTREKNNLRIALTAITERYTADSDEQEFKNYKNYKELLGEINRTRRKYHYNFLSMNEIFNLPPLAVGDNKLQQTIIGKITIRFLFAFPYVAYLAVFLNDITTINIGWVVSPRHTTGSCLLSIIFLTIIANICDACNREKKNIGLQFQGFYEGKKYEHEKELNYSDDPSPFWLTKCFYAVLYLFKLLYELLTILSEVRVYKKQNRKPRQSYQEQLSD